MSNRFKELRIRNGLSAAKLAELFGISRQYVHLIERSDREPSLNILKRYADYFNVSYEYLLDGKEDGRNLTLYNSDFEPIGDLRIPDCLIPEAHSCFAIQKEDGQAVLICEKNSSFSLDQPGLFRFKGKLCYSTLTKDEGGNFILHIEGKGPQYVSSLKDLSVLGYSKYHLIHSKTL